MFIALPLDREASQALEEPRKVLCAHGDCIKTVRADQYHITLKFLGDVDAGAMPAIMEGLEGMRTGGPIAFVIRGLGAFPSMARASVLWAGLESGGDDLGSLHRSVEALCAGLGFAGETRGFRPHLTLGRVRKNRELAHAVGEYFTRSREREFCRSLFSRLVLYESTLTPSGPRYAEIAGREL
jgi:2'-5' RNA ligase